MKLWLCLLLLATSLAGADNSLSKAEAGDGWLLLFDGESLFGWTPQSGAKWLSSNGVLTPSSDTAYLQSNSAFSDFLLQFDYNSISPESDCSVFLRSSADANARTTGYQLRIGDKPDWPAGSIVDYFKAGAVHPALNQWHSVEATLVGDHMTVKLDGRQVVDGKNSRSRAGVIVIGCNKAGVVHLRNLKLKPLGMKSLFNGTDLSGWKAVGPPPPKKKGMLTKMIPGGGKAKEANWSAVNGAIHGQGGQGQLESATMYDDFLLQIAIRVNSTKGKSGVFFRGDPGQLFSGYEVTVFNEYKDGNRAHALPESTGGLKGLQAPRREPADDHQFFVETIAARGRHMEVWVDGYPVSDFFDTRPEGSSSLTSARTAAGTVSLQSPDEKANLDFRNVQVGQLPKMLGKGPSEATAIQPPPPAITGPPGAAAAAADDANKAKIEKLMRQAFATDDPQRQKQIYEQILELDPNNAPAATGLQQAQAKIDAANATRAQHESQQEQQTKSEAEQQAAGEAARQRAQAAFLADDLDTAQTEIGKAAKLLPNDSGVADLSSRIHDAIQARTRLRIIWSIVAGAAVLGLVIAFLRTRGRKDAYLEIIEGVDKGKKFPLAQEVVHIGAVAEDGGNKNEIVLRDLERMISRFHCEIHKRNGKFFLIDCGSANGTRLDGQRAKPGKPMRVKSGARLELAGTCALRLGWERRSKDSKTN